MYQKLIEKFGEPTKVTEDYAYWQCPACKDSSEDNLVYCFSKNIFKTFCCDYHKELFKEIMSDSSASDEPSVNARLGFINNKSIIDDETTKKWRCFQKKRQKYLMESPDILKIIEIKRGINKHTCNKCGIGFDNKYNCWSFPIYYTNETLLGFEFRRKDFSSFGERKCLKEKDSKSCLVSVNTRTDGMQKAIILEGFLDAYAFYQYLTEQNQQDYYHILTPSMGVNTLNQLLTSFNFNLYQDVTLYLDSDEIGIKTMEELKQKYPVSIVTMNCGCKDFNEHYLQCIQNRKEG